MVLNTAYATSRSQVIPIEGIVIRTFASGDADLVLRVLSAEYGKLALFGRQARSSKKQFGAPLDIFDYGRMEIKTGRGSLASIKSFTPLGAFRSLRRDLDRMTVGGLLCEAFDMVLHEGQVNDDSPRVNSEAAELLQTLLLGLQVVDQAPELKDALRSTFLTVGTLLKVAGFLDASQFQTASAKTLLLLLDRLEYSCERALLTKPAVMEILQRMRGER